MPLTPSEPDSSLIKESCTTSHAKNMSLLISLHRHVRVQSCLP